MYIKVKRKLSGKQKLLNKISKANDIETIKKVLTEVVNSSDMKLKSGK